MAQNSELIIGAPKGFWRIALRKTIAITVTISFLLQHSLAIAQGLTAAPGPNGPTIITAPNGAPLINIVTPNSSGLSHNLFLDFNVGPGGVILNNSMQEGAISNLGGVTPGNGNLSSTGPASVILNEVTSTNPSVLAGVLEVFGQSADVIVANANGITCNGCGFINTPRATLTTGRVNIDQNGNLTGFTVEGGDVTFGANGANLAASPGSVDLFDVVSRSIHINGSLYAKHLRLTAGRNTFTYADGTVTPLGAAVGAPTNAIDGSALGALSAGRIRIISTELGSGVNMPASMAANAGELTISANGDISVGRVHGQLGVQIKTPKRITTGRITSTKKVKVEAGQALTLQTVSANGDIDLIAGPGLLSAAGAIETAGNLNVTGQGNVAMAALQSAGNMNVVGAGSVSLSGSALAGGSINMIGNGLSVAAIVSGMDFAATQSSGQITLAPATALAPKTLTLDAGQGALTATDILSAGDMNLHAAGAINYNSVQSQGSATITSEAGAASLSKLTAANGALTINTVSADVDLSGNISGLASNGLVTLNASSVNLQNATLSFAGLSLNLTGTVDASGATLATTSGNLSIAATSLTTNTNSKILAGNDLLITLTADLTNAGILAAAHNLTLNEAGLLINTATGLIYAGQNLKLHVAGTLNNNAGAITAGNNLTLDGSAAGSASVAVHNRSGRIEAGQDLSINTGVLTNEAASAPVINRNVAVAPTVNSHFTLNPAVLNKPVALLSTNGTYGAGWLYPGQDNGTWAEYAPQMWAQSTTLSDGTHYQAFNYYVMHNWAFSWNTRDQANQVVPRDANGQPTTVGVTSIPIFIKGDIGASCFFVCWDLGSAYGFNGGATISTLGFEDQLASPASAPGLIKAGGDLTIQATTLTNAYSSIEAGGDANLSGGTLTNEGVTLNHVVQRKCTASGTCYAYDANGNPVSNLNIASGGIITVESGAYDSLGGSIVAQGAMNLAFTTVNNEAGGSSIGGNTNVSAGGIQNLSFNPNVGNGFGGIAGGAALFTGGGTATPGNPNSGGMGGTVPNQNFLFETRAPFLDIGLFYGSAYFMNQIGYNPDRQITFLGDAYYENQLIDAQLHQQLGVGLGSFLPGEDAIEEMKLLLSNGADYLKANNMTLGEKLDASLTANLTKSIVVYETQTVNGREVLVPVVYLAAADQNQIASGGGLIQAASLTIDAGTLNNAGTIAAKKNLNAKLGDLNSTGGSLIAGNNIGLAVTGDVSFIATSVNFGGDEIVIAGSGLSAGGSVSITAAGDFLMQATSFDIDGNLYLSADSISLLDQKGQTPNAYQSATSSSIDVGGSASLKAEENIALVNADINADRNLALSAENVIVGASSETRTFTDNLNGQTTTVVDSLNSSNISAGRNLSIKSDENTIIVASDISAGTGGIGALAIVAGGDLLVTSGVEQKESNSHSSTSGFLSSTETTSHSIDQTNIASTLSAAGNVTLSAGDTFGLGGSTVDAGGNLNVDAKSVLVAGAQTLDQQESTTSSTGLFQGSSQGFFSIYGGESQTDTIAQVLNNASVLSAGSSVNVTAEEDLTLTGSQIEAGRDVNLDAIAGDVSILPGEQSFSASSLSSDWGFGISFASTPSSISIGIGINSNEQASGQSGESNAQSVIRAGRDVNISAGETGPQAVGASQSGGDITLTAAQVSAARDVSIVAEDNVTLNAATDTNTSAYNQSHSFAGLTLEVSSGLVSAAQSAINLGDKLQDIGSDGAYSIANAAMAGAKAYDAISSILKGGNIVSASLTIGVSTSQSSGQGSGTSAVVTEIEAGHAIEIKATAGDLTAEGVQIASGDGSFTDASAGDISLSAGGDILLASAANDNVSSNSNSTFSVGIGVATGIGFNTLGTPGLGLTGNISASVGSGQGTGTSQTNTHVTGAGDVTLSSGNDTTLAGAVVKGDTIKADVGGDLTITSVADTGKSSNSSIGMGLGFGGGDPFGGGAINPSLSSLSPSFGTGEGQTNWITEQSGLLASKTLEATVAGNTALNAGIINSTSGNLSLSTDTLTFQDAAGSRTGNSLNLNLSLDVSGAPGSLTNLNGKPEEGKPPSNNTLAGTWSMDNTRQEVKATIGQGQITIKDQAAQDGLVSQGKSQAIASLNRDETLANVTTVDEHHSLEIYVSTQSIAAAKQGLDALSNFLQSQGKISDGAADLLKEISKNGMGDVSISCGQQQGYNFNPFSIFISTAYAEAPGGCTVTLDGKTFKLSKEGDVYTCVEALLLVAQHHPEQVAALKGLLQAVLVGAVGGLDQTGNFTVLGTTAEDLRLIYAKLMSSKDTVSIDQINTLSAQNPALFANLAIDQMLRAGTNPANQASMQQALIKVLSSPFARSATNTAAEYGWNSSALQIFSLVAAPPGTEKDAVIQDILKNLEAYVSNPENAIFDANFNALKGLYTALNRIKNGSPTADDYAEVLYMGSPIMANMDALFSIASNVSGSALAGALTKLNAFLRSGVVGNGSGPWIDDVMNLSPGGAVAQCTSGSCVSAAGEMLTGGKYTQEQLLEALGDWSSTPALVNKLNKLEGPGSYSGTYFGTGPDALNQANMGPMAATLKAYGSDSHMVFIEPSSGGLFKVRDPWSGGMTYDVNANWIATYVESGVWKN